MQAALLACLLSLAPERPKEVARRFLDAFKVSDKATMAVLASRPARDVEYAGVVYALLHGGQREAASKLVELRGGGPEREGLMRQLNAPLPTRAEELAWVDAEQHLRQLAKCLAALGGAGAPIDGSLHGARILWTKGRALILDKQRAAALDVLRDCAEFARHCGWLARVLEAESLRLKIAPKGSPHVLFAADGLVKVLRQLDDRAALLPALTRRAVLLLANGRHKDGRTDLRRAITLAHALKKPSMEARLWNRLALHFHLTLHEPRRALKFYNEALEILRKLEPGVALHQALQNSAIVLTDLARYGEALRRLDEVLKLRIAKELRRLALTQRAYVLRRQGRVNKSRAASEEALDALDDPRSKLAMRVDMGGLEISRGDLRAGEAHFDHVLKHDPTNIKALSGRGGVRAMRGNGPGSEADFAAALKLAPSGQLLLRRAAARRQLGRIPEARVDAANALKALIKAFEDEDTARQDYGNTAVAYVMIGDLLLLEGKTKEAILLLEKAAVFFYRLKDVGRAIPAYARWTLTLTDPGEIMERFQTLDSVAQGTKRNALKSYARCVEGFLEWRAKQPEKAAKAWQEAYDLAVEAGSRERQASALAHLALAKGTGPALQALALMEGERLTGPQRRPFVPGESEEYAASIGLRDCKDAVTAFAFIERARADRLLRAMRGRAAVLDAMLPDEVYARYVTAHAALTEARAERAGVEEAERGFDAMVAGLRRDAPEAAAIAFPRVPALTDVRKALLADEALICMLDDPFVRRLVMVTKKDVTSLTYDAKKPLAGLELDGIRKLIVVPDGRLVLNTRLPVHYVPTAGRFLRLRQAPPPTGRGARRAGPGPVRLDTGGVKERLQLLHVGTPVRVDLRHPEATNASLRFAPGADAVVLAAARLKRGGLERVDGLAAAAEAFFARGVRHVIVPLAGPPPAGFWEAFYANCLDVGGTADFALMLTLRARQEAQRLGVVVWGVPAR